METEQRIENEERMEGEQRKKRTKYWEQRTKKAEKTKFKKRPRNGEWIKNEKAWTKNKE